MRVRETVAIAVFVIGCDSGSEPVARDPKSSPHSGPAAAGRRPDPSAPIPVKREADAGTKPEDETPGSPEAKHEKAPPASTHPGIDPAASRAMRSIHAGRPGPTKKTAIEDAACGPAITCATGLACNSPGLDGSGTCIPLADAKSTCEGRGDRWGQWGRARRDGCNRRFTDAGRPCTDSQQCKGRCLQFAGRPLEEAQCQALAVQFGCYAELRAGKAGPMLCRD